MPIAQAVDSLMRDGLPLRFTAYDGSTAGPPDSELGLELTSPRGLAYLLTAPGDLGMARAYVSGDLLLHGVHPGDPYDALVHLQNHLRFRTPTPAGGDGGASRSVGLGTLRPPPPPPQEALPRWRRTVEGLRHTKGRDAEAISHHYDVSNRFYELVLGPSMTYTCAVFPTADATLEEAQAEKYDLVVPQARPAARAAAARRRLRLGRHGAARRARVRRPGARRHAVAAAGVLGQGGDRPRGARRPRRGAPPRLPRRDGDRLRRRQLDRPHRAHRGPQLPGVLRATCATGCAPRAGCSTTASPATHNRRQPIGAFLDRYVFPDGELTGSGRIISEAQDAGLEVMHEENFRRHYALTLAGWCRNLRDHWDECVEEVGEGTARVWGLYMAGSRLAFERNEIQLHHVLAARTTESGDDGFPLRPTW